MQYFKALRTRVWFAISLIFSFALATFSCAKSELALSKNQISDFSGFKISAEAVPEGILVTFSNYSNIPPEIEKLIISVYDWGDSKDAVSKIWDDNEPFAVMNSLSKMHGHLTYGNVIERIRQTGTITFPFVHQDRNMKLRLFFTTAMMYGRAGPKKRQRLNVLRMGEYILPKI